MRNVAAALAIMMLATGPVFADGGMDDAREEAARRGYDEDRGGAYTDEMDRLIDQLDEEADANNDGHPDSGGVGDQTGHSAQMDDKAQE